MRDSLFLDVLAPRVHMQLAVAMGIAERAKPGSVILAMLADTGERYLTTPLFADIPEDMDADEAALSQSTPGYQMG